MQEEIQSHILYVWIKFLKEKIRQVKHSTMCIYRWAETNFN